MTPADMVKEVLEQRDVLNRHGFFGRFDVVVPLFLESVLEDTYIKGMSAFFELSTMDRLLQIEGVGAVRPMLVSHIVLFPTGKDGAA